jgi:lipoprotein signal peptidase
VKNTNKIFGLIVSIFLLIDFCFKYVWWYRPVNLTFGFVSIVPFYNELPFDVIGGNYLGYISASVLIGVFVYAALVFKHLEWYHWAILVGVLSNVLDFLLYEVVKDYIILSGINLAFNLADVLIIVGVTNTIGKLKNN